MERAPIRLSHPLAPVALPRHCLLHHVLYQPQQRPVPNNRLPYQPLNFTSGLCLCSLQIFLQLALITSHPTMPSRSWIRGISTRNIWLPFPIFRTRGKVPHTPPLEVSSLGTSTFTVIRLPSLVRSWGTQALPPIHGPVFQSLAMRCLTAVPQHPRTWTVIRAPSARS